MKPPQIILIVVIIVLVVGGAGAFLFLNNGGGGATGDVAQNGTSQPRTENQPTAAPTNTEIPFTNVVIAVQDIPRGVEIQPDMVGVIPFPLESVPDGAYSNPEDVYGLIARTDIAREQHVLSRLVVTDFNSLARTGSDAAAVLEPGRVMISLPIDVITSAAYVLQPGDRVDVIVSMLFVDVDADFQSREPNGFRVVSIEAPEIPDPCAEDPIPSVLTAADCRPVYPVTLDGQTVEGEFDTRVIQGSNVSLPLNVLIVPSEEQRPRLTTQRTVTDAEVIWVGEFPDNGRIFSPAPTPTPVITPDPAATEDPNAEGPPTETPLPPRPTIVSIAVRPQDAVTLVYLAEAGFPLQFALRSARTQGLPDTEPVTLDYIMRTYSIAVPERFTYSVEPAIRSIRSLSLGERIDLNPSNNLDEPTPAPAGQ